MYVGHDHECFGSYVQFEWSSIEQGAVCCVSVIGYTYVMCVSASLWYWNSRRIYSMISDQWYIILLSLTQNTRRLFLVAVTDRVGRTVQSVTGLPNPTSF